MASPLSPKRAADGPRRAGSKFVQTPIFEGLARAGFLARGMVYAVIGILALTLAFGAGGRATDQEGALRTIGDRSFGTLLLTLMAIGLGGYATWRLLRAAIGHGPEGSDSGFDRVSALASGLVYAFFCLVAVKILLDSSSKAGGSPDKTTGGVFDWPAGRWLVGLGGLVFLGVSLYQAYKGLTKSFLDDSKTNEMGPDVERTIGVLGMIGHLARGVVFALVGVFLVKAAVELDAKETVGLDGALAKLLEQSHGQLLLGVVAAGLLAFAAYSISDARYRKI